jgi:hypothetical protein
MHQKPASISILISIGLGVIVFAVAMCAKGKPYADLALIAIGILTAFLFIVFFFYFFIAQLISLICKKDILVKGITSANLIYIGIVAIAYSFYPDLISKILSAWDFRFAALGVALISVAIAFFPKKTEDTRVTSI